MARQRLPAEERREQILEVAVKLFSRNGFDRTTIREIARAAGINEATIYKHFETKEELYDAIIERFIEFGSQLLKRTDLEKHEQLEELLSSVATELLGLMNRDTTLPRLLLYSALQNHPFCERFYREISSSFLGVLEERLRQGQLENRYLDSIDPVVTARSFLGMMVFYVISQHIVDAKQWEPIDAGEYASQTIGIFLRGICTEQEGRK